MLIAQKQKRRKKTTKAPSKIRCTLRITPEEQSSLTRIIYELGEKNIRTNKTELIRVAINEFVGKEKEEQVSLLQQYRVDEI